MRIYGLTGGTGSGKSFAARRFEERGIPVIDADTVGHALIAPGGDAEEAVRAAFGPEILSHDTIDRGKLGTLVFSEPAALKQLNALVHPLLFDEVRRQCRRLEADGNDLVVVNAAVLGDHGKAEDWLTGLILVTCSEEERARRVAESRGMTLAQARQRIEAQVSPESKAAFCDWVIENEGPIEEFLERIDKLIETINA